MNGPGRRILLGRVLGAFGVRGEIKLESFTEPRGQILRYTDQPLSSSSGIIRFAARPGQVVRKGQVVARIYNTFGKLQETVTAPQMAIVLGQADASIAFPGVPLVAFGVP